jgi:hypothetical protein
MPRTPDVRQRTLNQHKSLKSRCARALETLARALRTKAGMAVFKTISLVSAGALLVFAASAMAVLI